MPTKFLSLFSGIEAASVAWSPLGWECVAHSEIEPFCLKALAHHYANVPSLGDIRRITQTQIAGLGPIDIVVFGWPCQDHSVAGLRRGMQHEGKTTRSGLFFDAMRVVRWAKPRFIVAENVPGLFSSTGGADFAAVVREILGVEFRQPDNGWPNSGVVTSAAGCLEWATLDAQYFGVPQSRRRVFLVADFGDWSSRQPILLNADCLCWHPAKGRAARKDIAGTIGSSPPSRRNGGSCPTPGHFSGAYIPTLSASDGGASSLQQPIALALQAPRGHRYNPITHESFVFDPQQVTSPQNRSNPRPGQPCHTLSAGKESPVLCFESRLASNGRGAPSATVPPLKAQSGQSGCGDSAPLIAFPANLSGTQCVAAEDRSPALGSLNPVAVAYNLHAQNSHAVVCGALKAEGFDGSPDGSGRGMPVIPILEVGARTGISTTDLRAGMGIRRDGDPAFTLQSGKQNGIGLASGVRRLTPLEWERLQGFPDLYTRIPVKVHPAPPSAKKLERYPDYFEQRPDGTWIEYAADGPRYKAIGNSMAIPVVRWIGERIETMQQV